MTTSALVAAGCWYAATAASAGSIAGTLYRDPSSQVVAWVAANPDDSRTPVIRDKIASQPQAHWMSGYSLTTVTSEVSNLVTAANTANQVPALTAYEIPHRDCGGAASGGAASFTEYQHWISLYAKALGTKTVIIILEPDGLALQTCFSSSDVTARDQAIATAAQTFKAANPNAKVYLDAGHSAWNSATVQGARLAAAGVQYADGYFSNVAGYQPLANEISYGQSINSYLQGVGISGKHQIIDTSRNGGAVGVAGDWCGDDNTDHLLGVYPTLNTGNATVDGYLWVKPRARRTAPCNARHVRARAGLQPGQRRAISVLVVRVHQQSATPSSPVSSSSPSSSATAAGSCAAAYQTTGSWQGGFQGQVTVTAGASAISNWKVTWTLASGQSITQLWNGTLSLSGTAVTVTNVAWNGTLGAHASTQFGYIATGGTSTPTLTCTGT